MTEDEWQYYWNRRDCLSEGDWLFCPDPRPMLFFARPQMSDRQHRLFAVACCRRIWRTLEEGVCRVVEAWERVAEGELPEDELPAFRDGWSDPADIAWGEAVVGNGRPQVAILRDILGNPFRPVTLDLAWLTSTVVALAGAIYAGRAFDRLPVLADALEEAGCDHADVLGHCRGDGPHVRGCWVADLVLGRT